MAKAMTRTSLLTGNVIAALVLTVLAPTTSAYAAKPLPDLKVTASTALPNKPVLRNSNLALGLVVKNSGKKQAKKSKVAAYASTDAKLDAKDVRLGEAKVKALKPKKSSKVNFTVKVSARLTVRSYKVLLCADDLRKVKERNEKNCKAAKGSLTIKAAPVTPPNPPGPDPETPSPLSGTDVTPLIDGVGFLYEGDDALQEDVDPDAIDAERIVILRGLVTDADAKGLEGVSVSVLDHPEFGHRDTKEDGQFVFVANGGGPLVVTFSKAGFLDVQRTVSPPVQDYAQVPPVVMVKPDPATSTFDPASSAAFQVARGSEITDGDGTRQQTLLFPAGADPSKVVNGVTTPLTGPLTVRATEFTEGPLGSAAMPGSLPPTSAYTYAVDLRIDQAATADSVVFDEPVISYTENFVDAPVGTAVPAGYYDETTGAWVPEKNGRVIKVISETAGRADVDVTGDDVVDTGAPLTKLGITDAERGQLATLYAPGDTLWRMQISHFSAHDFNFANGFPPGATPPPGGVPEGPGPDSCGGGGGKGSQTGSVIVCEEGRLTELLPVAGTPYALANSSLRTPGNTADNRVRVPVFGATVPPFLKSARVTLDVAGHQFVRRIRPNGDIPPTPNLVVDLTWDGKDIFGRDVQGRVPAEVTVTYTYDRFAYPTSAETEDSFGQFGESTDAFPSRAECALLDPIDNTGYGYYGMLPEIALNIPDGPECGMDIARSFRLSVGSWDATQEGLGGWSFDVHHRYLPATGEVLRGDGSVQDVSPVDLVIRKTLANGAVPGQIHDTAVGPDGTVYVLDLQSRFISRVTEEGTLVNVAGNGAEDLAPGGTSGPALSTPLMRFPDRIAAAPDGTLIVTGLGPNGNGQVKRLTIGGRLDVIAGNDDRTSRTKFPDDPQGGVVDNAPGPQTPLGQITDSAVMPDGTIVLAELPSRVNGDVGWIRRMGTDGKLHLIAGGGPDPTAGEDLGDGEPARLHNLWEPTAVAIDTDGSILLADRITDFVQRITLDGMIRRVAGSGANTPSGNGVALDAGLPDPKSLAVGGDGSIYVRSEVDVPGNSREEVRVITTEGRISRIFGKPCGDGAQPPRVEGSPAADQCYIGNGGPNGLDVTADGAVLLTDFDAVQVLRLARGTATPGNAGTVLVPSPDGGEIYEFSPSGRHLQTLDGITGKQLRKFDYTAGGQLASITEVGGRVTTITRDSAGLASAIVAPGGQTTATAINANRVLTGITGPGGRTWALVSNSGKQLTSFTDPRGKVATFVYAANGLLTKDTGTDGSVKTLVRNESIDSTLVTFKSGAGRVTKYLTEQLDDGVFRRTTTFPTGGQQVERRETDGTVKLTADDGTIRTTTLGPDPRWGMSSPVPIKVVTELPSGKTRTDTMTRTATLATPGNPLSATALGEVVESPAGNSEWSYAASNRTLLSKFGGRVTTTRFDAAGRVDLERLDDGLDATTTTYGANGLPASYARGNERLDLSYDAGHRLISQANALGHTYTYAYNAQQDLISATRSGENTTLGRDEQGRLTGVTSQGGQAHQLTYDNAGRFASYRAPGSANALTQARNLDGDPTLLTLQSGDTITNAYDAGGRRTSAVDATGTSTWTYAGVTTRVASTKRDVPGGPSDETLSMDYDGQQWTGLSYDGPAVADFSLVIDPALRPGSVAMTGGETRAYGYASSGRLTQEGAFTITRDGAKGDQPASYAITGGKLDLGYDSAGRPSSRAVTIDGTERHKVSITRDNAGRIATQTEAGQLATYSYDALDRLVGVDRPGTAADEVYTYDTRGNRTGRKVGAGANQPATYDAQDRLTSGHTFDADGFLATRGADTFDYAPNGDLISATVGGTTVTYAYDGMGRRVARTVGGQTTQYLYADPWNDLLVTATREPDGTITTYQYDEQGLLYSLLRGGVRYLVAVDQVGTPLRVLNAATGAVAKQITRDTFGVQTVDTAPAFPLAIGFAGGIDDQVTGLTRFGARDYEALAGRWTARDPILYDGGQANLYAYVDSMPQDERDPSGLGPLDFFNMAPPGATPILSTPRRGTDDAPYQPANEEGLMCLPDHEMYDQEHRTSTWDRFKKWLRGPESLEVKTERAGIGVRG